MAASTEYKSRLWIVQIFILYFLKTSTSDRLQEPLCLKDCHCDSVQQVVDCRGAGFTSIPQNIPSETISLDLSENPLQELSDFPQLEKLKALNITNFSLKTLKSQSLKSLTSLEYLNIGLNLFESIPKDLDIPALKVLILSKNRLLDFKNATGPILNSKTLQELDLSNCRITTLPEGAFSSLPSLIHLNLHDNLLSTLPSNIFQPLNALSTLDLSDNGLLAPPNITFMHNPNLKSLNYSVNPWNKQYFLEDDAEETASEKENVAILISTSIEILDLSTCKLTALYNNSLSFLPNLRHLHILNTPLKHIDRLAFQQLSNLEKLDLSWTDTSPVIGDLFTDNHKLTHLVCPSCYQILGSLSSAPISHLDLSQPEAKIAPTNLISLLRSHYHLKILPPSRLASLGALNTFRMRNCGMLILSSRSFENNQHLRVVDFTSCGLRQLPGQIFSSTPNITEIILKDNFLGIDTYDEPLFTSNSAVHLDLSDNVYRKIRRKHFSGLHALVKLNLSSNPLFGWEAGAFSELNSLEVLDLSHTLLVHLQPNSFITNTVMRPLPGLGSLEISTESPTSIGDYSFHLLHLKTLKELYLSHANLYYLPNNSFSGTPSLEKLVLSHNSLRTLDFNFLDSRLPHLMYLDLSYNPWRCDCALEKMRNLWYKRNMKPRNHFVVCDKPESVYGHSWEAVNGCTDSHKQRNFTENNEPKIKESNKTLELQIDNRKMNEYSHPVSNTTYGQSNEGSSVDFRKISNLPRGGDQDDSISKQFPQSEPKKSSLNSMAGGIFMGILGMVIVIGLGFVLYNYLVRKRYRILRDNRVSSELDL